MAGRVALPARAVGLCRILAAIRIPGAAAILGPVGGPGDGSRAAVLALQHIRHLSIYAVVWACYVPALVETTSAGRSLGKLHARFRTAFVLLWIAFGILGIAQAVRNRCWDLRIPTTQAEDPRSSTRRAPSSTSKHTHSWGT